MTDQPTVYRIEFGPAWPVPPITVDFADHNAAARRVAERAIPHLKPVLAAKGRPELAVCFFQTDQALTAGQFMWLSLEGEKAAQFCPARLKPTDLDPEICGDEYDADVCDLEPGHDGDHCANVTVGWTNRFARPAAEEAGRG